MPNTVGDFTYPKKPPPYWLAAKRRDQPQLNERAIFRIWWKSYDESRRLIAWMAAPPEDWRVNGMEKPHG